LTDLREQIKLISDDLEIKETTLRQTNDDLTKNEKELDLVKEQLAQKDLALKKLAIENCDLNKEVFSVKHSLNEREANLAETSKVLTIKEKQLLCQIKAKDQLLDATEENIASYKSKLLKQSERVDNLLQSHNQKEKTLEKIADELKGLK